MQNRTIIHLKVFLPLRCNSLIFTSLIRGVLHLLFTSSLIHIVNFMYKLTVSLNGYSERDEYLSNLRNSRNSRIF